MEPNLTPIFAPSNSSKKTKENTTMVHQRIFQAQSPFESIANLNIEEKDIMFKLLKVIIFL